MSERAERKPWQRTEREAVVAYLKRRADFWDRFPAHRNTARALRNEAHVIELGRHTKLPTIEDEN